MKKLKIAEEFLKKHKNIYLKVHTEKNLNSKIIIIIVFLYKMDLSKLNLTTLKINKWSTEKLLFRKLYRECGMIKW